MVQSLASGKICTVTPSQLPEGEVRVAVAHSTVNYKDALAVTGKSPVVRRFPMVPGIDFAGVVETSGSPSFQVGDKVDARVTNIDPKTRKLGLSIKAREIAEEKEAVEQYGSSDSGASLGDILGAALKGDRN